MGITIVVHGLQYRWLVDEVHESLPKVRHIFNLLSSRIFMTSCYMCVFMQTLLIWEAVYPLK